jgi:hypothetical protein
MLTHQTSISEDMDATILQHSRKMRQPYRREAPFSYKAFVQVVTSTEIKKRCVLVGYGVRCMQASGYLRRNLADHFRQAGDTVTKSFKKKLTP